jgi:DNA-directed RNA polymerase subunit K/omega
VIRPPLEMGKFEFVAIAALRAAQLTRGCRPKVDGVHTTAVLAQREVAEGKVSATNGKAELPLLNDDLVE